MDDYNNTLILNTTAIDSLCSQYNSKLSSLETSYADIASDFQAFLNCGVLSTYIPDLKNNIEDVVQAIEYIISNVRAFAEEQERIENNGYDRGGNTSYDKENTTEEIELLSENDYNTLFSNDEFLAALLSIVKEHPDILTNESMCDLLKELLLKSGITDENILNILNENDSKALQTTIYKLLTGELSLLEANDKWDEIKSVILASIISSGGELESGTISEVDSDISEGGQYVRKNFTASNGVEVDYYVYLPTTVKSDKEIPMHLFLWPTRAAGPGGYFNVHGLPALLRKGQSASGIVICPRLGANEKYTNSMAKALKELLDSYAAEFNVDENRISISGQGGGGQAAVNIATKYPDYFSKVAGVYSSAATSDYGKYADSKEQAELNVASNDILLIKSRGGGDELNTRSAEYTDRLYKKLSKHDNVEVIDNPSPGDLYGHYLYQNQFTYDGKTYKNFLEYMFAQTK